MPRIIRSNHELRQRFHELKAGDTVLCRVPLRPGEEYPSPRPCHPGVRLFPPAMAQLASRSKVCQARLLKDPYGAGAQ